MPRIDDVTARALAEVRYMPLSYYLEVGKPETSVRREDVSLDVSVGAAPPDQWERLEWLLACTALPQKKAA